jgi:hypothetical protein
MTAFQPSVPVAAAAITAVAELPEFLGLNEPYRAAAYALGYEPFDGSPWWSDVMDTIG